MRLTFLFSQIFLAFFFVEQEKRCISIFHKFWVANLKKSKKKEGTVVPFLLCVKYCFVREIFVSFGFYDIYYTAFDLRYLFDWFLIDYSRCWWSLKYDKFYYRISISEIRWATNNQKIIPYYLVDITRCNSKRSNLSRVINLSNSIILDKLSKS